jgi:hypothetical protein
MSLAMGMIAALGCAAHAGGVSGFSGVSGWGNNAAFLTQMTATHGSGVFVDPISSVAGGNVMNFALTGTTGTVSSNTGSFYLGVASNLAPSWTNGGGNAPGANENVLAFGNVNQPANSPGGQNNIFNATSVTITLDPGVRGFGFNFDDVEASTLSVLWSDNSSENLTINSVEGFAWMVANAGLYIKQITLTQTPGSADDGFTFYNFQVAAVPLPPAAWVAIGILVPAGVVRHVKRRRSL